MTPDPDPGRAASFSLFWVPAFAATTGARLCAVSRRSLTFDHDHCRSDARTGATARGAWPRLPASAAPPKLGRHASASPTPRPRYRSRRRPRRRSGALARARGAPCRGPVSRRSRDPVQEPAPSGSRGRVRPRGSRRKRGRRTEALSEPVVGAPMNTARPMASRHSSLAMSKPRLRTSTLPSACMR